MDAAHVREKSGGRHTAGLKSRILGNSVSFGDKQTQVSPIAAAWTSLRFLSKDRSSRASRADRKLEGRLAQVALEIGTVLTH